MEPDAILIGAGVAILAAGLGWWIGRRTTAPRIERLRADVAGAQERARQGRDDAAEARRLQELTLGSMREGVLLVDGGGRTVFANAAVASHFGARPLGLSQVYPPSIRELATDVATSRTVGSIEYQVGSPGRWLQVTATPAGDDGSVLLVVTDVTERRLMEAVRTDFVANASHELKTPAASIQAAAETLRQAAESDPAAVPRFAAQLERDAVRLSRIVADLLDLSRLETGSALDELVRLDALVREEGQRFEEAARRARLSLEVEAPGSPAVLGSARDLSLLVRNLVDNAIRYTRPDGRISVRVATDGVWIVLEVRDTGVGIPSRDLHRVFERFYRVDRARSRETGGTGLGLAIVRHVAENHGGNVSVASELGQGSTFEVRLPVAPTGPEALGTPASR
jgi:two-component system, OmpR family, sensor histidine kinase SenX3